MNDKLENKLHTSCIPQEDSNPANTCCTSHRHSTLAQSGYRILFEGAIKFKGKVMTLVSAIEREKVGKGAIMLYWVPVVAVSLPFFFRWDKEINLPTERIQPSLVRSWSFFILHHLSSEDLHLLLSYESFDLSALIHSVITFASQIGWKSGLAEAASTKLSWG